MLGTWQPSRPAGQCHCHLSMAGGPGGEQNPTAWETNGRQGTGKSGLCGASPPPTSWFPDRLTLSLCSMNSAKFKRVCVTSAMSWEVRANSMLLMSSSCWSSFSSDQQDTKAALKRSLKADRSGDKCWKCSSWCSDWCHKATTYQATPGTDNSCRGQGSPTELAGNGLYLPHPIWQPLVNEHLNSDKCD